LMRCWIRKILSLYWITIIEIPYILPDCWVMFRYLSLCWGFRRKNTCQDSYFNQTTLKPPITQHRAPVPEYQSRPLIKTLIHSVIKAGPEKLFHF
ncbi:MAG: hypothetical protein ACFE8P_16400, partial [Promethearchaeota archaeon]